MFAGSFAPRGYAFCNGQLLPINQYDALYSLIGTAFGGDGQSTFALPNLQGRIPIHQGQGAGLSARSVGETGGLENVTLTTRQIPVHTHSAQAQTGPGDQTNPAINFWAASRLNQFSKNSANKTMNPIAMTAAGGGQSHENLMPFQAINFCISLFGQIPSQV